ncbi:MAG TPA: class I SAM-dependent methyltransferase [Acidimicrobiia bacterium]|nr:class I SAM-dependent methyltransferase [Acidimicrobiia bacterium]
MPPLGHDPEFTARRYDAYAEREWDRHEQDQMARTSFAIHCRYLDEFVAAGDVVLDVGAGPGRFTIELAKRGARIHVGDLSPVQLALNEERVRAAGHEESVASRTLLDICDLSMFTDDQFDAVVCFGGPLSYVMDRAPDAVTELCRVTRPGGHVLISVMSSLGAIRRYLPEVLDEGRRFGAERNDDILRSGDLPRDVNDGHEMHMFRWRELAALLGPHGEIVGASASNFVTAQSDELFESCSETELAQLLAWELELCREPGALDGGTHILAVVRVADRG